MGQKKDKKEKQREEKEKKKKENCCGLDGRTGSKALPTRGPRGPKNREMDFFFIGNFFVVLNAVQPIELPEQWHKQAAKELKTMLLQTQAAFRVDQVTKLEKSSRVEIAQRQ